LVVGDGDRPGGSGVVTPVDVAGSTVSPQAAAVAAIPAGLAVDGKV
jgi:hypothetical protein